MILTVRRRLSPRQGLTNALPILLIYIGLALILLWMMPDRAFLLRPGPILVVSLLGLWRYSWMTLHIFRALIYQYSVFPRIRRRANTIPNDQRYPARVYFLIPSYKEVPWISQKMLQAVLREAATIPSKVTLIVSCGSESEESVFLEVLERHPHRDRIDLVLMRQQQGKRLALGHALRAISRRRGEESSLTVFMDGDSVLGPESLGRSLTLFSLFPKLGAVTTDEISLVEGSRWYRKWYELRFSQRHRLMQSLSLSRRVLTLTGRYSVFRTEIATEEKFLKLLEEDSLDHWLYGRFKFLTGDDKSTWFHVLEEGWEMLYVPDAITYSLESSGPEPFRASIAKMYRWFGNMLRNNGRAIKLGPSRMGFFIWWCLVDQRLSIWTSLAGPTGALLLTIFDSAYYLPWYLFGATLARVFYLMMLCLEGHRLSFYHLPQLLYTQWVGALVKINVLFRLDRQSWGAARGGEKGRQAGTAPAWLRFFMPMYQTAVSSIVFTGLMALVVGVLEIPNWPPVALASEPHLVQTFLHDSSVRGVSLHAADFGVIPDDDLPDSSALDRTLAALPPEGIAEIILPPGKITLSRPWIISRDDTWIRGAGHGATVLSASFPVSAGSAMVLVQGTGRDRAAAVELQRGASTGESVLLLGGSSEITAKEGQPLWVGYPNTEEFVTSLGAQSWNREYPWLRQTIKILNSSSAGLYLLDRPLRMDFPQGARVEPVNMVRGVRLSDFSLRYVVPDADPMDAVGRFENLYPDCAVDSLVFEWAQDCLAEDIDIVMTGRHAFRLENAFRILLRRLDVDGAWNKGEGGNGYAKFSRAYRCRLKESTIQNLRHVVFQWSASENEIINCRIAVDVNFHGGFAHHNHVIDSILEPAPGHPWPAVYRTPDDAHWAPPDGPDNEIITTGAKSPPDATPSGGHYRNSVPAVSR